MKTEFQKFEKRKRIIMGIGLGFLLLGFLLQIVAFWWTEIIDFI